MKQINYFKPQPTKEKRRKTGERTMRAIRTHEEILLFRQELRKDKNGISLDSKSTKEARYLADRNELMFFAGINIGMRICDLLQLRVEHIMGQTHIILIEQKTGMEKMHYINNEIREAFEDFISLNNLKEGEYIFKSRQSVNGNSNRPFSTVQAWRIMNGAAKRLGWKKVGTHTIRKTFGLLYYLETKNIAYLMKLFNHSIEEQTLDYIDFYQKQIDESLAKVCFGSTKIQNYNLA